MSLPINYLLQTYIVTSKPKRISVADGFVHIVNLLSFRFLCNYNVSNKLDNDGGFIIC